MRPATRYHCIICQYNLHGLPRRGRCPECGAQYDFTDLDTHHAIQYAARRQQLDRFDMIAVAIALVIFVTVAALTLLM